MASTIPDSAQQPQSNGETLAKKEEGSAFTLQGLKDHSTRESFWMLLHDKVYDVSAFLDEHPGGDEVMLEEAGKDATEAFEDVGHSDEARAMLTKMYLGEFQGEKTSKAKKAVAAKSSSGSSTSSGGYITEQPRSKLTHSFPLWTIPAALFFAYLAWRMFLA